MNMNINMNMNMTMTLCPVRHALYLVASLTEQNLQRNDKTSDHHDHHHQDLPVNSDQKNRELGDEADSVVDRKPDRHFDVEDDDEVNGDGDGDGSVVDRKLDRQLDVEDDVNLI